MHFLPSFSLDRRGLRSAGSIVYLGSIPHCPGHLVEQVSCTRWIHVSLSSLSIKFLSPLKPGNYRLRESALYSHASISFVKASRLNLCQLPTPRATDVSPHTSVSFVVGTPVWGQMQTFWTRSCQLPNETVPIRGRVWGLVAPKAATTCVLLLLQSGIGRTGMGFVQIAFVPPCGMQPYARLHINGRLSAT